MDVGFQRSVQTNLVRVGEDLGVACCAYEAAEDFIAGFDGDSLAIFGERGRSFAEAIAAERSVEANTFVDVAEKLFIRFFAVAFGDFLD